MTREIIIEHSTVDLMDTLINTVSDECKYFKVDEVRTRDLINELYKEFYPIIYDVIEKSMKRRKRPSRVTEFLIGIVKGSIVVIVIEFISWVTG